MPRGKGTYSKPGRPSKREKASGSGKKSKPKDKKKK